VRYGTADEFAQLGVRKEVEREGILRAIEIEGADLQPCGGRTSRVPARSASRWCDVALKFAKIGESNLLWWAGGAHGAP